MKTFDEKFQVIKFPDGSEHIGVVHNANNIKQFIRDMVDEMVGKEKKHSYMDEECEWCGGQFCQYCAGRKEYQRKREEIIKIAKKYI